MLQTEQKSGENNKDTSLDECNPLDIRSYPVPLPARDHSMAAPPLCAFRSVFGRFHKLEAIWKEKLLTVVTFG